MREKRDLSRCLVEVLPPRNIGVAALVCDSGNVEDEVGGSSNSHVKLDRVLQSHMMPAEPPHTDIANDAHEPWASIWTPDVVRRESFDDLYAMAVSRCCELMQAADGYMQGKTAYATLRALHGGNSYDSGLAWQTTCSPFNAPGVKK